MGQDLLLGSQELVEGIFLFSSMTLHHMSSSFCSLRDEIDEPKSVFGDYFGRMDGYQCIVVT